MKDRVDLLVEILLDPNLDAYNIDDAAMDLGDYNDDRALKGLVDCGSNPEVDEITLQSCGESIGRIWVKRDYFNKIEYQRLTKSAQDGVYITVRHYKPEWIEKYKLV